MRSGPPLMAGASPLPTNRSLQCIPTLSTSVRWPLWPMTQWTLAFRPGDICIMLPSPISTLFQGYVSIMVLKVCFDYFISFLYVPIIATRTLTTSFLKRKVPLIFGTIPVPPKPTTFEMTLSKYMQRTWGNYAKKSLCRALLACIPGSCGPRHWWSFRNHYDRWRFGWAVCGLGSVFWVCA